MRDIFKVLLVLVAALSVCGCGDGKPQTYVTVADGVEVRQLPTIYGGGWHQVYFVTSRDGTRCAIYAKEGGITCDWSHKDPGVER